jgi:hypothetical protein
MRTWQSARIAGADRYGSSENLPIICFSMSERPVSFESVVRDASEERLRLVGSGLFFRGDEDPLPAIRTALAAPPQFLPFIQLPNIA